MKYEERNTKAILIRPETFLKLRVFVAQKNEKIVDFATKAIEKAMKEAKAIKQS